MIRCIAKGCTAEALPERFGCEEHSEPATWWRVIRSGPGNLTKVYGPFSERGTADRVAMNAAIKHGTATVRVEPARKP